MSTSARQPASGLPALLLSIALVTALAVVAQLGGLLAPATAAPTGYTGVVSSGTTGWADAHLAEMLVGEPYSDTLTAPFDYDDRDHGVAFDATGVPDGLTVTVTGNRTLQISGTPTTAGPLELEITWYGTEGERSVLTFSGEVEASTSPTITTITAIPEIAPHTGIVLTATVVGAPSVGEPVTGTVVFSLGGVEIGRGTLSNGSVTVTGVAASTAAGAGDAVTATYLGDAFYSTSTSASSDLVVYVPTASGTVRVNGAVVSGASVALVDADDPTTVIATGSSDAGGLYSLSPGSITSLADTERRYLVRATLAGVAVYYSSTAGWNVTDPDDATPVGPTAGWGAELDIARQIAPVWSESTLAVARIGSSYSDEVTATSPNAVTYTVSTGALPTGLSLNGTTGAITGTPSCSLPIEECVASFTIRADNGYGAVTQSFTWQLLPAGVGPAWTDETIGVVQVGVVLADGVAATGDDTITYRIVEGALPAGLSLNGSTGAITGTPTVAGAYRVVIEAANEIGTITTELTGTVAAAPDIDLVLDFAAGTHIDDATTDITGSGLKIGSTYTLTLHSDPVVLHTGTIDGSGGFTWTVAIPADTPAGLHRLVLTGVAPDDTVLTREAWFTLLADGTIGGVSYTGPTGLLAATGAGPLALTSLASSLMAAGLLAALIGRRRRTAA